MFLFTMMSLWSVVILASGLWSDEHNHLLSTLFQNYNKLTRPSLHGEPTVIHVSLLPQSLLELDEKTQSLNINMYIHLQWTDHHLTWNATDHSDIDSIYQPQSTVWVPPLSVINGLDNTQELGYPDLRLHIRNDGTVSWVVNSNTRTQCLINVSLYPFDTQTCHIELSFFPVSTRYIHAINIGFEEIFTTFSPGGIWQLEGISSSVLTLDRKVSVHQILVYEIKLRRRRPYYVVNILLPLTCLSLIPTLVFLLPVDSGEKMGVSITVLLAYSTYLSVISDQLPQTSLQVCYLQVYLTILLALTTLGVVVSVLVLKIHHITSEVPVGWLTKTLVTFARKILCMDRKTLLFRSKPNYVRPLRAVCDNLSLEEPKASSRGNNPDNVKVFKVSPDMSTSSVITGDRHSGQLDWPTVAETLDRASFIVLSLVMGVSGLTILSLITLSGGN